MGIADCRAKRRRASAAHSQKAPRCGLRPPLSARESSLRSGEPPCEEFPAPGKIGTDAAVGKSVLRQAEHAPKLGPTGQRHGRTAVRITERISGFGPGTQQAADAQQRIGRSYCNGIIKPPRTDFDQHARQREGVVEPVSSGMRQLFAVGVQAVKRIGRFDVGAGLAQAAAAGEKQRFRLPQGIQAEHAGEHKHRNDDDRGQDTAPKIWSRRFHFSRIISRRR